MSPLRDSEGKPKVEGLMAITNIGLQEFTEHPFGKGLLTTDGQQYSAMGTGGTAANTYATAVVATVMPPGFGGQLYELEFGLTSAVRRDSTVVPGTIDWQWQGRSLGAGGSFRNLHAVGSSAFPHLSAASTTFSQDTYSGRLNLDKDLDRFPIEIQLLVRSKNLAEDGVVKVKNSSYVKGITSALYRRAVE